MEIKKFNEYLSDENTEKSELSERLMSIAGEKVVLGRDTEHEIKRMLEDGRLFDEKIVYLPGVQNRCHANVASRSRNTRGFNIASGYALADDGSWYCHSWGYNKHKRCIFETTNNKYSRYYGYELNRAETIDFQDEN